jgi:hypothetical protein
MRKDDRRAHQVTVPDGKIGAAEIRSFEVPVNSLENLRLALRGGRQTIPGWYTQLLIGGQLWMSDTDAEYRDHWPAINMIRKPETRNVLINGLGIGLVLKAALDLPHIHHVDVVENNADVIKLVAPHYESDPRVTVHHADAYLINWPTGRVWDVVWHDIWEDLNVDNLPDMFRLHRRYGARAHWQGSWGKSLVLAERRREQKETRESSSFWA